MGEAKRRNSQSKDDVPYRFRVNGKSYKHQWVTEVREVGFREVFLNTMFLGDIDPTIRSATLSFMNRRYEKTAKGTGLLCISCDEEWWRDNIDKSPESLLIIKIIPQHQGDDIKHIAAQVCSKCVGPLHANCEGVVNNYLSGTFNSEHIRTDDPGERIN